MSTVLCPQCKTPVEISEALREQVQDQILAEVEVKHKEELKLLQSQAEQNATKKVRDELDIQLKNSENEIEETKKRNKEQQVQLLKMMQTIRDLKEKDDKREVIMQRKLDELSQKAKENAIKQYEEEHRLKDLEKDKKINDMLQTIEELKRKGQQGSQQLQGEVQELDLENILKDRFTDDEITPVAKGVVGADITQLVKTNRGNSCGVILIESKRTKTWGSDWVSKLKSDVRARNANAGIIVSSVLPKDMSTQFGFYQGVFVTNYASIIPLIELLRDKLREIAYQKSVNEKSGEKAEVLYNFLTSQEFRQKMEAIAEVYQDHILQVAKERAAFEKIWKAREAQAQKLLLNAAGLYGSVQGIVGKSILQVKAFELLDGKDEEQLDLLDS